jgi:hypothetical protein
MDDVRLADGVHHAQARNVADIFFWPINRVENAHPSDLTQSQSGFVTSDS